MGFVLARMREIRGGHLCMAVTCHLSTAHGVSVDISSYGLNMEESLEFLFRGLLGTPSFSWEKNGKRRSLLDKTNVFNSLRKFNLIALHVLTP